MRRFDYATLGRLNALRAGTFDVTSPLQQALASTYSEIVFESQVSPPITIPLTQPPPGAPRGGDIAAYLIKPKITLRGPAGEVSFAPAGEPVAALAPVVMLGAIGLVTWFGYRIGHHLGRQGR